MIKITNGEASAFQSPAIVKLFEDSKRVFPTADAFRLADIVQQIQSKTKLYQDQARKIIEANNGEIDKDGRVTYAEAAGQIAAAREIEKLNAVEIELTGQNLEMSAEWPKLSLTEALILKPLLSNNGSKPDA